MLMDQDRKLMSMVIDWKNEIGAVAGPFLPTDTKQSWLARAARRCAVSARHITSLYYGHVTDPKFSVAASVLSAADQARLQEARRDAQKLAEIYQNTAVALGNIDPDFHRGDIDALVNAAGVLRSLDRTRIEGPK
jgi:hypothetical protein